MTPNGWTEATPGGKLISSDPVEGGIIDRENDSGKWFIISNDDHRTTIAGLPSREEAVIVMEMLNKAIRRYRAGAS